MALKHQKYGFPQQNIGIELCFASEKKGFKGI